ncbi:MAG: hypothetical protein Q7S28_02390 [bacterium]|nr:hypothetical protein [bacterium]
MFLAILPTIVSQGEGMKIGAIFAAALGLIILFSTYHSIRWCEYYNCATEHRGGQRTLAVIGFTLLGSGVLSYLFGTYFWWTVLILGIVMAIRYVFRIIAIILGALFVKT